METRKIKKYEDVDVITPALVGPDHRTDQHHRGAGRAEKACRQGAEGEHCRVGGRRADEISADADAARNNEQREQQDDERQVVEKKGVQDFRCRRPESRERSHGNDQGKRPEGGHLAEMMLPEFMGYEGEESDGEEQTREWNRPGKACAGAIEMRGCRRSTVFQQKTSWFDGAATF